jgi:hypothetical protein
MPSTVDQPNLLLEIDQIGRSAGVSVATIGFTDAQPSAADNFSTVAISLTFKGDFYSITDLLYRLRSLVTVRNGALQTSGRLFSVASVALTPATVGSGLAANVSINAYVYGGAAAAPVVAPVAPASTSTDTTQTTTTPAPSSDVAP